MVGALRHGPREHVTTPISDSGSSRGAGNSMPQADPRLRHASSTARFDILRPSIDASKLPRGTSLRPIAGLMSSRRH